MYQFKELFFDKK